MNMVTTCPSCLTSFIVKPHQLKAHQGQVRCSQCQHVFLAKNHINQATFLAANKKSASPKGLTSFLAAILVVMALSQVAFYARSNIAQQWPITKPFLTNACQMLGCEILLPQHAELISIDDTDLVKDEAHQDIIKFNCVLNNNAPYTQAFPSIELTLTDSNDQALTRRKIRPNEYLKDAMKEAKAGLGANEEIQVNLNLKTTAPVAGFRAFVVY